MSKIDGGATLWARQTIDSDIFYNKPDKWFKIWFYLVNKTNHKDNKQFKRGSSFLKYEWIMEKTKATKNEVAHCIKWLKSATMIATAKATGGFIVNVLNYNTFQTLENYKSDSKSDRSGNTEATQKQHRSDTIYKNDKNERIKEKKKNNIAKEIFDYWNGLFHDTHLEIKKLTDARKRKINTRTEESSFDYKEIFQKVVDSKFLTDPNKEWKGFCFDWVIDNDHNYIKILEGKYNDKE